jgi:hypothetical protein
MKIQLRFNSRVRDRHPHRVIATEEQNRIDFETALREESRSREGHGEGESLDIETLEGGEGYRRLVPEILNAWLWQARLAVRGGLARSFAAHGYVDPSYRPPRLPFVSVVGPMSLQVEPEREAPRAGQALLRLPGHVIGQQRAQGASVPAAGGLRLRFGGRATVTLGLAGLPGTAFGDPATGPAVAQAIQGAIAAARAGGGFREEDGSPVVDAELLAAFEAIAVRWSQTSRQLAVSAAPGSAATGMRSSVEVLPVAGDLAPALGLAPPAVSAEGRFKLHKLPPPRPMMVEVRLDLWASSQSEIAVMFDGLAAAAPTRGRLALRPSLLADDVAQDATEIRLLGQGEPTGADSLVHLEGGDGATDRARGAVFAASAGAAAEPAASRFRLSGAGQLVGTIYPAPLVPDPLVASHPMPGGFAVAVGVQIDPGSAAGDSYRLLQLSAGGTEVVSIEIDAVSVNVPNEGQVLFGEVVASATLERGNTPSTAVTRWRQRMPVFEAAGTLHATVAPDGAIGLAWEGEPQRLDDPQATPVAPTAGAGRPVAAHDMVLSIGGGGGQPLPRPISVSHVHLVREPVGPIDPRLRRSVTTAAQLRPGDLIALATSDDGWHLGERKGLALVADVSGDRVFLTRPVGGFRRGAALVYQDEAFFHQVAVKRRDDLMNRLYHCSVDYKVSALLEDPTTRTTAVLVREAVTDLTALGASRAPGGHPGTTVVEADSAPGAN